jgi:hypothetical protein
MVGISGQSCRDIQADSPKARRTDRDEQGLDGLTSLGKIAQAARNELLSRQNLGHRYLAPALFNSANRSLKSGFNCIGLPPGQVFQHHFPRHRKLFARRIRPPELAIEGSLSVVELAYFDARGATSLFAIHAAIVLSFREYAARRV